MIRPVALRTALSRLMLALAVLIALMAIAIAATDGVRFAVAGVRFSLTSPGRAAAAAAVLFLLYTQLAVSAWRSDVRAIGIALAARVRAWATPLAARPWAFAAALAVAVGGAGLVMGSWVAGGADASGYVSQARLIGQGRVVVAQPLVAESPWPQAADTWAPLGYRPAAGNPNAVVPTYPPGLPLLMAAMQALAGFSGAFVVVPLCGAALVWLTYLLGRRVFDTSWVALWASLLVATSPTFLYQLMNPMSDVPVAAAWTLALVLLIDRRPLLAGLASSLAVAIRPNLVPIAAIPLAWLALEDVRLAVRFAIGMIPGPVGIALLNAHLYGSPFLAGYGRASDLYAFSNGAANVALYGGWMLDTETPLMALAALLFLVPSLAAHARIQRPRLLLGGFAGATVVSYLFYTQFETWTYLRFFLPVWPILMVMTAGGVAALMTRLPARMIPLAALLVAGIAAWQSLATASGRYVFEFGRSERKYVDVARFVSEHTEPDAVLLSMQHSGSLPLYTGRATLRYDVLDPQWLDRAIEFLRSRNRHPYIVIDDWEIERFQQRFGPASQLGRLDWQPLARLAGQSAVYDALAPDNSIVSGYITSTASDAWYCYQPVTR